jgi:hypothetical protein
MGRVWKFKEILGHKRVQPSDPDYMGSMAHVQLLWETGEVSWEPLHTKTRPACTTQTVTVAIYAEKHGLLDTLAGNFRDSRNEPRPRNDLSAVLTKQAFVPHQGRIHVRFQVPATTNKLLVSMKTKRTPSGKTLQREFREIDEYETFNDKGKDINLALVQEDTCTSHLRCQT